MKDKTSILTKKQLAELISDQEKLTLKKANEIVEGLFAKIEQQLKKKDDVRIPGFGKFFVSRTNKRDGINPATGAKIQIPAANHPKFSASKTLKDMIDPNRSSKAIGGAAGKKTSTVVVKPGVAVTPKPAVAATPKTKPVKPATPKPTATTTKTAKVVVKPTPTSQPPKATKAVATPKPTTKKTATTKPKPVAKPTTATAKTAKVVVKPKSTPTITPKKAAVAKPVSPKKTVVAKPKTTTAKKTQTVQAVKTTDLVDRKFKNNEEFYQAVKETAPVVAKPTKKITEPKVNKKETVQVDAETRSQSKIFKNSEFTVDKQDYSEPTKIQKKKMKNVFNVSTSHKKFKALSFFTWLFLTFLLLMVIGSLVIKLVNAAVNGAGISAQFWNGPNGEPIAMSFKDLNGLANYLDLVANIMIMIGIPLFGVLFLLFMTINVTASLKNALRSSEYNRVEMANLPSLIKVETKSQTLVAKKE